MKEQIKKIQERLHELNALQQKTDSAEQKILASAIQRLDRINAELLKLRSRVLTDKKADKQYRELILERGRLNQVIANGRMYI